MFVFLAILSVILFFGGIFAFCKSFEIGFTNEERGELRRWGKANGLSARAIALRERKAERKKLFLRYCACTMSAVFFFVGLLTGTFCLFWGGAIGNPPSWKQDSTVSLHNITPDFYILETNEGLLVNTSSGPMFVEESNVGFSLRSPEKFWNRLEVKEVSSVAPSMTVYHGQNGTNNTYTKVVLLVPQGTVG